MQKKRTLPRSHPELQAYVNSNYKRIAHWIDECVAYDEVISNIESELQQGDLPYRKELRMLMEIIRSADNLGCLEDCARKFVNNQGCISWGRIRRFCADIRLYMDILNKEKTLYTNIYPRMLEGEKLRKRIDKTCSLLMFPVTGKPAFRDQVAKYKDSVRKGLSLSERSKNLFEPTFISIFKPKKETKPKAKPVVIVCIATGATRTFSTQKECQEFLGISKPTFKSFAEGSSKLNKTWRLQ